MGKKKNNKAKEVKEFVMEGLKEIAEEVIQEKQDKSKGKSNVMKNSEDNNTGKQGKKVFEENNVDEKKILKAKKQKNQEKETGESKSKEQNVEEEKEAETNEDSENEESNEIEEKILRVFLLKKRIKETKEEDTHNNQVEVDVTKVVAKDTIDEAEGNKDKNPETDLKIQYSSTSLIHPILLQEEREEEGQGEKGDNMLIQKDRLIVIL
ncbi:nucleolar protein 12-like [Impatiens glandulifera]|uniref:nucleolar protein 12-like n=1 Tax=Impatiens glandulifera TaxID=253017 RepID=UPI001FB081D1|nr:nucleolar protein 12-like [Impatiens glandulifera]